MHKGTDSDYLRNEQYKNSSNLNARAELHRRFSTSPVDWQQWVFDQLDLPENARILELGAGPGWLWLDNRARIAAGWRITLSDMSAGMVEEQRRNLAGIHTQMDHQVIDAQDIPFDDAMFDAVIANHMLYHVPDLNRALAKIRRILKPDGRLYAATNGNDHMIEIWGFIQQLSPVPLDERDQVFHRNFRLEDADKLLKPYFASVEKRLFEDGLRVTEAGPLVNYICSGLSMEECPEQLKERGRAFFQQMIDRDGAIHITKSTGLFVCQRT
jgi:SAM-dependent methyltransferase